MSSTQLDSKLKQTALTILAAGNFRSRLAVKRVISYLFDHPDEAQKGGLAFVKCALADPFHPSRTYPIRPVLDDDDNREFIDNLSNSCLIVYNTHE